MNSFVERIDHINIVVKDLDEVKDFFLSLGFTQEDESRLEGDWISETVGLKDVAARYVKLTLPGDRVSVELLQFDHPPITEISSPGLANTQGYRHVAFRVNDIVQTVSFLKQRGINPLSPIQEYAKLSKKLVYFRGPEGILLELAQYPENG
ncbi:MAG: VOC family protein [Desulfobulbaceae bacterium]|nr:MAG: VOC family protein [Desulfobulbaceae bacterium]